MDTEQTELILNLDQLKDLTRRTIGHYEFNAENYRLETAYHDVSQNYEALLDHIESKKPFKILDLGCGPGRDLKYFKSLGHIPVGIWPNDLKYCKSLPGPHPKSRILKGISDSIESNNAL